MSRLWIFSDLHQDWPDNAWDPAAHAPACDVIVVAGDAHAPLTQAIKYWSSSVNGRRASMISTIPLSSARSRKYPPRNASQ